MRSPKYLARHARLGLSVLLGAAPLLALVGCGGGGARDLSAPAFRNANIATRPSPLTFAGGTATMTVQVTDESGIEPDSVRVDVVDAAGTSIIGGRKIMDLVSGTTDTYTFQVNVPDNAGGTAPATYTAQAVATDLLGHSTTDKGRPPFTLGSVSVPNPPPPPGGP